jgi:hypothetical protein
MAVSFIGGGNRSAKKISILQTFSYMQIPIMISTTLYFLYLDNYNDELQSFLYTQSVLLVEVTGVQGENH